MQITINIGAPQGGGATGGTGGTGGTGQTGGTGGTGGTSGGGGVSGGGDQALMDAAGKAYDGMASIEKEIANLDPNAPDYQKKLMQLQQKMNKLTEMIKLISQIMTMKHDTNKQIIGNIR